LASNLCETLKQLSIETGGAQNFYNAVTNVELAFDDSGYSTT